jgi:hypothetical protein
MASKALQGSLRRSFTLLGVTLLSLAIWRAALAQPAEPVTEPAQDPDPAAQELPVAAEETIVPASGDGTPLDDYQASEQISEDLSVSFPVDI